MKIVDKYKLAEMPPGTPFIELGKAETDGSYYWGNGNSTIEILDHTWKDSEGKWWFNGVTYLEPDNLVGIAGDRGVGSTIFKDIMEDQLKAMSDNFSLISVDTSIVDFCDEDRFLVLNKHEFKKVIDVLMAYYDAMPDKDGSYENN